MCIVINTDENTSEGMLQGLLKFTCNDAYSSSRSVLAIYCLHSTRNHVFLAENKSCVSC